MALVNVKVKCVNIRFLMKSTKAVSDITRITFAHNSQNCDSAFECFLMARIAFHKITSLASTEQ